MGEAKLGETKLENLHLWIRSTCERLRTSEVTLMANENPKMLLYDVGAVCLAVWLLVRAAKLFRKPIHARPRTPDLEKPASRNGKAQRPMGG